MKHFRYSMFELLVLIFGAGTVIFLVLSSPWQIPIEIVAQLLLIPILIGTLHYGRNGGLITFSLASVIYLAMRVPDIIKMGLIVPILQLIVTRILVYGVVGIGGGIVCTRIKYLFVKLEQMELIDNVTGLYNQRYLGELIKRYGEEFERYQNPFSMVILRANKKAFKNLTEDRFNKELREIGFMIRNSIRAVDEVGRIEEVEFGLVFPNTDASGAAVAGKRLQRLVANYVKKHNHDDEAALEINVEILGYPADKKRVQKLLKKFGIPEISESRKAILITK